MKRTLNVVLSHQPAEAVHRTIKAWAGVSSPRDLLLAYGGDREEFGNINHEPKIFIDDPRLRTRDHQREFQSYTGAFKGAAQWLASQAEPIDHVHFAEFDHLPLVPDLNERQISRLTNEHADVLGFHLMRIDGTSNPHFLYHAMNRRLNGFLASISVRDEINAVFSMFVTGSLWTREAFVAVAELEEPFPMYFELYLPTVAHHLGFRLRSFAEQNQFVRNLGDWTNEIDNARRRGAWTLHPVKSPTNLLCEISSEF